MSSRNLLRSMFRKRAPPPTPPSPQKSAAAPKHATNLRYAISTDELKASGAIYQPRPEALSPSQSPSPSPVRSNTLLTLRTKSSAMLGSIAEDEGFESDVSSVVDTLSDGSSPVRHGSDAVTMREDFYNSVEETKAAIVAHLDTIDMTLDLLRAFEHFSPTIEDMKREMVEKKGFCVDKLRELGGWEVVENDRVEELEYNMMN